MDSLCVHITAYGCQMNRLDAALVAEVMRAAGARIVADPAEADVLLFLTCAVRGHAEDRVFSNLGALAARKRRRPDLVVGLLGCMAQEHGAGALARAPVVDLVCAPGRLADLPDLVARARAGERPVALDPRREEPGAGSAGAMRDGEGPTPVLRGGSGDPPRTRTVAHGATVAPGAGKERVGASTHPTGARGARRIALVGKPPVAPGAAEVDAACISGVGAYAASDAALDRIAVGRTPGGEWPGSSFALRSSPEGYEGRAQAYVVAMRGCDNFCAYCVVPYVRGPERSRPPETILEEARRLVGGGVREITLLGQAVNRYRAAPPQSGASPWRGRAASGGRTWDLADLLAAVAAVPDLARLRFVTSHPGAMTPRLARAFRDVPRLMPHLHMPAQSGSDAVLGRMNRGYTAAEYAARVAMVREAAPGVAVVSDFIVGFPGETAADFEATLDLVRQMRFAAGFVFKYSPRPGTAAARQFPDDVPAEEKRRRHQALSEAIAAIAAEENRRFVGRRVRVLVEGASPRPNPSAAGRSLRPGWGQLRGRTPCHRLVVLDGPPELIGREVEAEVVEAGALTLFGRIPEE